MKTMSLTRPGLGAWARTLAAGMAAMALLGLGGCTLDLLNRQAADEAAERARPPGSVYLGWRVFQDRCAGCHGPDASGTPGAPDLLVRVRTLDSRRFVGLVLSRYDWPLPKGNAAEREAAVEAVLQREPATLLTMPAWRGEPRVSAHIVDLYAYLSARALGTQGPERPTP